MLQYAKRSGRKVFQALFSNQSSNSLAEVEVSEDAVLCQLHYCMMYWFVLIGTEVSRLNWNLKQ